MGSGAFLVEACRFLGDELIKSWYAHYKRGAGVGSTEASDESSDRFPTIPPDEDEVLYARRLVAQRCLYGVDKNEMAVDLAKLSLWLVTLAKDHPFTFLDHSLRHGDSLVGLTRQQIIAFHWEPTQQRRIGEELIQRRLDRATEERVKILNAREDAAYRDQEQRLALANEALEVIRLTGDACVSAFFSAAKAKDREARCNDLFQDVSIHFQNLKAGKVEPEIRQRLQQAADSLRSGEHPIPPFHWEIEFPEVFSRENGGFDAFVGNPPFLGGKNISSMMGNRYLDWLKATFADSAAQTDLVAYFFQRAFTHLSTRGAFGLIATNTIAQGDTRDTGLRFIRKHNGTIYSATRRLRWPGVAAVIVSVVHVASQPLKPPFSLDNRPVKLITAYLLDKGHDDAPKKLSQNDGIAFTGGYPYGAGFIFDDNDESATSISEMNKLIQRYPECKQRIRPYIGGAEVLNDPRQRPSRFVIDLGELSEAEAAEYRPLVQILEAKVKPERMKLKDNADGLRRKKFWWRWGRTTPTLDIARKGFKRVLMHPFTTNNLVFVFIGADVVVASPHPVFVLDSYSDFSLLQSRVHETWARLFASSFKDDLRYTASDCFDTFPFPENYRQSAALRDCGQNYYETRARHTAKADEGLTSTYNRFHSPGEQDLGVLELRRLHGEMDVAVLNAYGWDDLAQQASQSDFCEFLLDYEEDDEESASGSKDTRLKRKPWRYRWPDEFRDEVLARLLELNEQRHKEELAAGIAPTNSSGDEEAEDADEVPDSDQPADSPPHPPPHPPPQKKKK
jgi:hypothetical protein